MQNRIEYIDIAKGITIFLVVIGHVKEVPILLTYAIYSFHMPLFFLLSGFFFREDRLIKDDLKKLTRSLLLPYLVVALVMILCCSFKDVYKCNLIDYNYSEIFSILGVIWKSDGKIVSVGPIWFLVVLFWSKLYLRVIIQNPNALTFLVLGAFISISLTKYADILFPFGLQQSFVCSLFVYVGFLCKKYNVFNLKISTSLLFVITFTVLPFSYYFGIATRTNIYNFGLFSVLLSSVISIIVVLLIKRITFLLQIKGLQIFKSFLLWSGKYSVVILAIHSVEDRFFSPYIFISNYAVVIIVKILYIVISCWLILRLDFIKKVFNV